MYVHVCMYVDYVYMYMYISLSCYQGTPNVNGTLNTNAKPDQPEKILTVTIVSAKSYQLTFNLV